MEKNPVFGTVFHNRTYLPPTPDYIEKREDDSNFTFGQEKDSDPPHKTEKKSRVNAVIVVLAIALILTLALALASTALAVLSYSESHALKQEMQILLTNQTTTVTRGITCQTVQAPTNGHVTMATGTNLLTLGLGSVATYSCNTGLGLVGQTTRVCEDTNGGTVTTGTWNGSEPTCEEIFCSESPAPQNGTMSIATTSNENKYYSLGSVAKYSCNTEFALVGQTTRVCEDTNGGTVTTGTWSGSLPTCEEILCSETPALGNGRVSITPNSDSPSYGLGSVAAYSCNTGFVLDGQTTRVCEDKNEGTVTTGTWSGSAPTCQEITCSELTTLGNGTISTNTSSNSLILGLGSVAIYTCNVGFVLVGQTTRVCEDTNGGTVTTGTWSGSAPTCEEIFCSESPAPQNGTMSIATASNENRYSLGSVARYSCNTGFALVGQTTRVCEDTNGGTVSTGTWSGSLPTCEEILCSETPALGNGRVSITPNSDSPSYGLGSVATYSCNTGFGLVGQKTRVCEDTNGGTVTTGTWSGSEPTCEEITCTELPTLENGTISTNTGSNSEIFGLGSVAIYTCNVGFVLVGQTTRVCEDTNGGTVTTGTWSGSAPTCEEIFCSESPAPQNGTMSIATASNENRYSLGSVATYSCNTGFALVGQTTRVCEDTNGGTVTTGIWSGSLPTCEEILCSETPALGNGRVSITPNSDSPSYGLGSIATYSCDTGFVLVGQTTRVCEDTNGGTVTTGTWSGSAPTCEEITCTELTTLGNGTISTNTSSDSLFLGLGSIATYTCNTGFGLVGQTTRVCEDTNGGTVTTGTWSGSPSACEEILCQELPVLANGTITIEPGNSSTTIRLGFTATYSCSTGFGLVGETTRVCEDTNGGTVTTGTWSGSAPTCEEILCQELPVLANGTITIVPGNSSTTLGLEFTATYSCNTGFALVGQTTRVCQDTNGGTVTTGTWSGSEPTCEEILCPELLAPGGGTIMISGGINLLPYSLGSIATYSCNTGSVLVGQTTRVCEDTNGGTVTTGTWSGSVPTCEVTCSALSDPGNGTIRIVPDSNTQRSSLGSIATYSCNTVFGLIGQTTRVCQEITLGTVITGTWSGNTPTCVATKVIDCQQTDCRSEQLTCPERSPCVINCEDSRRYACYQTAFTCSAGGGDCTVNCDDSYACFQSDMTCPEGGNCLFNCNSPYSCQHTDVACSPGSDCLFNCDSPYSCQHTDVACSAGDGQCIVNCDNIEACRYANITCPEGGNCTVNCGLSYNRYDYRCRDSIIECKDSAQCTVNCGGYYYGCYNTSIICSGEGGDCSMNCNGNYVCQYANITCPKGKDCTMNCEGYYSCYRANFICPQGENCTINCTTSQNSRYTCRYANFICSDNESCTINCVGQQACQSASFISSEGANCTGQYACQYATFTCSEGENCAITCNGQYSCSNSNFGCPEGANCTVNCNGQFGCQGATVTCPTGDYSCNIHCTDPLSCPNLRIINTDNVNIHCCGDFSCGGVNVPPTSRVCPFID